MWQMFTRGVQREEPLPDLSQIPSDLINPILSFLDLPSLLNVKCASQSFNRRVLIQEFQSEKTDEMTPNGDFQNQLYTSIVPLKDLDVPLDSLVSITLQTRSHDQGWASHRGFSYSWGQFGFCHLENHTNNNNQQVANVADQVPSHYSRVDFFRNKVADNKYQTHRYTIYRGGKWWRSIEHLLDENSELGVWARSLYPGWTCFMDGGIKWWRVSLSGE